MPLLLRFALPPTREDKESNLNECVGSVNINAEMKLGAKAKFTRLTMMVEGMKDESYATWWEDSKL
jgi:hypothetical protein